MVTLVIVGGLDNLLCHLLKDEQEKEVERVGAEDQCEGLDSFTQETLGGRQNSGLRKRLMFKNLTVCRCTLIVGG